KYLNQTVKNQKTCRETTFLSPGRTIMPNARLTRSITSRRTLLKNSAAAAAILSLDWTRAQAQAEDVRIGVIYDLTGPFAAGGSVASSVGTQIAIDLVNEKGGIGGKYKIVPVAADSQSKPDVAINEAERLISQEKIDIIDGIFASSHAVPLSAKVEQQKKILWITTAVSTAVFKDKNLRYVFRAQIHSDQYGQAFASFLSEHAKERLGMDPKDVKVALIHEDGPYGVGVAAADEAYSKQAGLQVVLKEGYSASAPDLSVLVSNINRSRLLRASDEDQALPGRRHLARRLQSRYHPVPAPGARERPALQDAVRRRRRLQPARQVARGVRPGHRQFLQYRSRAGAIARPGKACAGDRRSHQNHGRALQGQDRRNRRAAALLHGFQPALGPAQQRAAGRQGEVWRLRSRSHAQGGARRRHSAGRYHPGLWRQVLSAGHADVGPERALD